jgi:hypothetical protein
MGANLRQLAVARVGAQGLNTEISAFESALDFALKAENCVIDRVGRLASREAFADYVSKHDFEMTVNEQFDIVRVATLEPDKDFPTQVPIYWHPTSLTGEYSNAAYNVSDYNTQRESRSLVRDPRSAYGVGVYNRDEYNGITNLDSDENVTLCLVGIGALAVGSLSDTRYGSAQYGVSEYVGETVQYTQYDRYIAAILEDGRLKSIPEIQPNHGVTDAQLVPFKDAIYVFSKGDPVMVYERGYAYKLSDHPRYLPPQDDTSIIAAEIDGDIACAAYGRLWVSGVNGNYDTIYYSDLLVPHQWYDGKGTPTDDFNTAGIIDVREYWPNGNDRIKGLAAHNGFLVVFGRQSILIFQGVQGDPAAEGGLSLYDAIRDVGLLNQDAMCNIGTDHLFVDSIGVRALGRVIQEKSSPIGEPSLNVSTAIREEIAPARDIVRLLHFPSKSKAICLFPNTQKAYCFQLGQPSATGGLRVTQWTGCDFWDSVTVRSDYIDRELLAGRNDRGLLVYNNYTQPSHYTMSYESTVLMAGESLMQSMIPKSVIYSYHSEAVPKLYSRWSFGSNEMQYMAKVRDPRQTTAIFKNAKVNISGSGEMFRIGFDCQIDGDAFSMQQISINAVTGRVMV